jgi:hypothetical protein
VLSREAQGRRAATSHSLFKSLDGVFVGNLPGVNRSGFSWPRRSRRRAPATRSSCLNSHIDAPLALWKTRGRRAGKGVSCFGLCGTAVERGVEAESAGGHVKVAAKLVLLVAVGLLLSAVPSASTHTGQLGVPCTSGASSITLGGPAVTTWYPPGCIHQ